MTANVGWKGMKGTFMCQDTVNSCQLPDVKLAGRDLDRTQHVAIAVTTA